MAGRIPNSHKAPSNKDGKEGSQESARSVPGDQQDIERPVASKGHSAVGRARLKRVFNCLQVAPISHYWRARSGREVAGKSGECLADRRATVIRGVADEPKLR